MHGLTFLRSLRWRLILWNAAILALVFGALGAALLYAVERSLIASVDRELASRVGMIVQNGPPGAMGPPPGDPASMFAPRLIAVDGSVNMPPYVPWDPQAYRQALAEHRPIYSTVIEKGQAVRVVSQPFPENEDGPGGVIQAPYLLTDIYAAIAKGQRTLLSLLPLALLGAGLGGKWLMDRSLRSVRKIARTAERIGAEDLTRRLDDSGGDEFASLAATFNRMLGRLELGFAEQQRLLELQRRFTADASHELQTPVAVVKANTSLTLTGDADREDCLLALKEIDSAADSMTKLVQDLLLLARSDGGRLGRNRAVVPIREVVERAIERVSHRRPSILLLPDGEALCVEAHEDELIRVFVNLLENAQRHTPPDGSIEAAIRAEGDRVVVTVADSGAGIAPEHLPHLGERFYRVDSGRARTEGGTGLGLSICRSIIEAHSGALAFESAVGDGTTVTVSLPLTPESETCRPTGAAAELTTTGARV